MSSQTAQKEPDVRSVAQARPPLIGRTIVFALALCLAACIVAGAPSSASAAPFEVDACTPYTTTSGVFQHAAVFGIGTALGCHTDVETDIGMDVWTAGNTSPPPAGISREAG
jgi:hypothetical protein